MKKIIFLFVLVSSFCLQADCLKERLLSAKVGDYILSETGKSYTFLCVREKKEKILVLDEVTLPIEGKKEIKSWQTLALKNFPKATSWNILEIDLESGKTVEAYDVLSSGLLDHESLNLLLTTLLQKPLEFIPPNLQRKIGSPPLNGEVDQRSIWKPTFHFEGKSLNVDYDVYTLKNLGEEIFQDKVLTLYFDKERLSPFPSWIDIDTGNFSVLFKTVDAGKNFTLPKIAQKHIPPYFTDMKQTEDGGIYLSIFTSWHFQKFHLFAVNISSADRKIHPLPYMERKKEKALVELQISKEVLEKTLEKNQTYIFVAKSEEDPSQIFERKIPFVWNNTNPSNP